MVFKSTVVTDIDELDSISEDWNVQLLLKLTKEKLYWDPKVRGMDIVVC